MPRELVKHYFWMCLWGFLKEISIWFSWLSKDSHFHQCENYHLISWELWRVKKREKRENSFSLLGRVHPFFLAFRYQSSGFSDLQNWGFTPCAFPVLWFFNTDWIVPPIFLIVQLSDCREWDFSAFTTVWLNSYKKSPFLYMHVSSYPSGYVTWESPY